MRVDGEILGLTHNVADLAEFLRRAGLEIDSGSRRATWIDWRGVGGRTAGARN